MNKKVNSNINPDLITRKKPFGKKLGGLLREKASILKLKPFNKQERVNQKPKFILDVQTETEKKATKLDVKKLP